MPTGKNVWVEMDRLDWTDLTAEGQARRRARD